MKRFRVWLLIALAPALMGQACGTPDWILEGVRILEPHHNAVRTCKPFRIDLDFNEYGDPLTLEVYVNDVDVSDRFSIGATLDMRTSAHAEWVWEDGVVGIGDNTIDVVVEFPHGPMTATLTFAVSGDPFADDVVSYTIGTQGGFNELQLPDVVRGGPVGGGLFNGGTDVFSLGLGGTIDLIFQDNVIYDDTGDDFTVFENSFLTLEAGLISGPPFTEPARVSVSQDGVTWYAFPCNLDLLEAPYHPGCAGVYPVLSNGTPATPHASIPTLTPPLGDLVGLPALGIPTPEGSGGDSFDLADVGIGWARYVRLEAATFVDGPVGSDNAGFDLDAVAAIHSFASVDAGQTSIPDCPVLP